MPTRSLLLSAAIIVSTLGGLGAAHAEDRISTTNYYAAYYDGHHGPISDGYWGRHGKYFWYKDRSGIWHRDDGTHFQREPASGYALIHGSGATRAH